MIMKKFIFGNKSKDSQSSTGNPFTAGSEGREEWNDRYFSMKKQIAWWQIAFLISSIIAVLLAAAAFKYSTQSHIQPVVVEVCNGEPKNLLPVSAILPNEDRLVKYAIDQFITNSRMIIADAEAQKGLLDKTYAYSAGSTLQFLNDYYHQNNPFELAKQMVTQVMIIDSIKISPHTWQITWDEIRKNVNGNDVLSKKKWVATITVQLGNVNQKFIKENPFGIFISQMSWSEIPVQKV
jgi:type IV secretion system protein VirB5